MADPVLIGAHSAPGDDIWISSTRNWRADQSRRTWHVVRFTLSVFFFSFGKCVDVFLVCCLWL